MMEKLMESERPESEPLDTMKVRGRLRGVWLALWLAARPGAFWSASMKTHRRTRERCLVASTFSVLSGGGGGARGAPLRAGTRC